jgi:hypothetical protein
MATKRVISTSDDDDRVTVDLIDDDALLVALTKLSKAAVGYDALAAMAVDNYRVKGRPTAEERENVKTLERIADRYWSRFTDMVQRRRAAEQATVPVLSKSG